MNNEPVAYGKYIENAKMWLVVELDADMPEGYIPLYTHLVKELTYEDGIEECAQRAEAYAYMSPNFTALAEELRAILRKAQEK